MTASTPKSRTEILVVDDNATYRNTLAACIEDLLSIKTHQAANAQDALSHIQRHPTHLLITDTNMPEMSGVDLLVKVRKQNPQLKVVVLFSSLNGSAIDAQSILALGAYMVMSKAEVRNQLFPRLRSLFPTSLRSS